MRQLIRLLIVTGLLCALCARAEEQTLEQAANDPTASLMNVQVSNGYIADFHNLSGEDGNTVLLRSAIPFTLGEQSHIFRVSAPVITNSPILDDGLSDMTVFDLVTFDASWGRWGAGMVGLLPTGGSKRGTENWGLGPAFGFTAQQPGMLWGLFNQNIFSVASEDDREEVNVSTLQPILSVALGSGWRAGFSEMTLTYDWENTQWSSLPLGGKLSKLVKFGKLPVQFSAEYEYNFADDEFGPEHLYKFTCKFIFPGPG